MKTIYVNQTWGKDKEVARCWITVPKTIEKSMAVLFIERVLNTIKFLMNDKSTIDNGGFHIIDRFCQFVYYFNYDSNIVTINDKQTRVGVTIELLSFNVSDDVNDIIKYAIKLRNASWEQTDIDKIKNIGQKIKDEMYNSDFEVADMIIENDPNDFNSYL